MIITRVEHKYYCRLLNKKGNFLGEVYLIYKQFRLLYIKSVIYTNPYKDASEFVAK